ncbi:hypothetical protein [Pseudomonas sp. BMS12]|uniref:hypothetical protein n=1 Tax=Pseudomonas sp. BMS12 TaxID=1796033 RepID=UPI000A9AB2A6|nr:hypothetical protein [Pseudomonas sp. BMS12]
MRQLIALASLLSTLSGCAATTPQTSTAPVASSLETDDGYCFQLIVCPLVSVVDFTNE